MQSQHLDYNTHTHQSGDFEPFKNTHHLWQTQHKIHNTFWICTPTIITKIQSLREKEWSHLIQSQIEKKKIQCNSISLLEKSLKQILEKIDMKDLIWYLDYQERKTDYLNSKRLLKTFSVRAKSVLNQLKQIYQT